MTEDERNEHYAYRKRMLDEIRRLRAVIAAVANERDEWKERWEAERADHEATIRHTNKMLAEDYP